MRDMNRLMQCITLVVLMVIGGTVSAAQQPPEGKPQLQILPAEHYSDATATPILAATRVGARIVAVGDSGVVLLSDDAGKTYRQARNVPISSTLTSVSFADTRTGWAVGHWGAIVKTTDGGESWTLQRSDTSVDQPLFSVYFKNAHEGWAVGLWSLMLHTTDGGATWSIVQLPPPSGMKKADRNLYAIFGDAKGDLFVACEQGRVIRSTDGGSTWAYAETGYKGSFWTGLALHDGTLLVAGLRGSIFRSTDDGHSWAQVLSPIDSSITSIAQSSDSAISAVGLDGAELVSKDDGATFQGRRRPDRSALTAVVVSPNGSASRFSDRGVVMDNKSLTSGN